jgi:hypothetical protein
MSTPPNTLRSKDNFVAPGFEKGTKCISYVR